MNRSAVSPSSRRRRGSALIIVLGILSVLILMGVAFSTFVRTERGGATNLKNAFVARASLATALGRVMEAIDASYDSPTDTDPVAPWPRPWLASSGDEEEDYFQSAMRSDGDRKNAYVITAEIAEHLTPAQLALAKSAKCNWTPIRGSISASPPKREHDGVYGLAGRPEGDDLVGRFAFIALETTGLADVNVTGGLDANKRKTHSGGDTTKLLLTSGGDSPDGYHTDSSGSKPVYPFVRNATTFDGGRFYTSLPDAKSVCKAAGLRFDTTKKWSQGGCVPENEGDYYPADLFAGFAPSLAELDPEGRPKIVLPKQTDIPSYGQKGWGAFASRTLRAMVGMFARGRAAADPGSNPAATAAEDELRIFSGAPGKAYNLSRARLATVALLDGLDADAVPGRCASPTVPYLKYLKDMSVEVVGPDGGKVTVTDKKPTFDGSEDPLNYPCTESAPLLSSVYAYIKIDDVDDPGPQDSEADPSTWAKKVYSGTLHVGAVAINQNKTDNGPKKSYDISLTWNVMSTKSDSGYGAADGSVDVQAQAELGEEDDFGEGDAQIVWKNFFGASGSNTDSAMAGDTGNTANGRLLEVRDERSFTVECSWNPDADDFYPPTRYQYEGGKEDLFAPVRMKVKITSSDGNVQQVPAPAIDSKAYWLRVDVGLYHGEDSHYGPAQASGGDCFEEEDGHAVGWAFCACPAFGFDTTGLANPDGSSMKFWRNNAWSLAEDGGGEDDFGNPIPGDTSITEVFFSNSDAFDAALSETGAGDFDAQLWNYLQAAWLFFGKKEGSKISYPNVSLWLNSSSGAHMPDMLHSASPGGGAFIDGGMKTQNDVLLPDSERLAAELHSRIPANGYKTVADLGSVMCGPYETLSLFKTWRLGSNHPDFHPVLDYFTTEGDRQPKESDYRGDGVVGADGDVDLSKVGDGGELFSAVHNGRVNLNAPPLVVPAKMSNGKSVRGKPTANEPKNWKRNPYPIAQVLNGAPVSTLGGSVQALDEQTAFKLAGDLCHMLENASAEEMFGGSDRFDCDRRVVRNLSFLGMGEGNKNPFLSDFVDFAKGHNLKIQCDYDRESILRGIVDGFSTRGQTFLVIIRADAYSPKFGENDSPEDGTTLATTHALVELFRDPVPARLPDGSMPVDAANNPVVYHNWFVRSFRVF